MLDSESRDYLIAVLPEAILCTREVGETARKSAYELIVGMCEANIGWKSDWQISGKGHCNIQTINIFLKTVLNRWKL